MTYLFKRTINGFTVGLLVNRHSFWVGLHYSSYNQRYCINPLPFVTFWLTGPGGKAP